MRRDRRHHSKRTQFQKALYYSKHCDGLLFVDDSGLEVYALAGAPGVYSARYAGPDATDENNNRLLLDRIARSDRTARFRVCRRSGESGRLVKPTFDPATGRLLFSSVASGPAYSGGINAGRSGPARTLPGLNHRRTKGRRNVWSRERLLNCVLFEGGRPVSSHGGMERRPGSVTMSNESARASRNSRSLPGFVVAQYSLQNQASSACF